MKNVAYYNGKIDLIEEMTIPINDRAVFFGDGIYDVLLAIDRVPFGFDHHMDRFFENCEKVQIDSPYSREELKKILLEVQSHIDEEIKNTLIYFQMSRGTLNRNHAVNEKEIKPNLLITVKPTELPEIDTTIDAITTQDLRGPMSQIKSLSLMPSVMVNLLATKADCGEAIYLSGDRVVEASHSAVGIIVGGKVVLPPLSDEILPSVTREHFIRICETNSIEIIYKYFSREEMMASDEVFVLSTSKFVMQVRKIDSVMVGGKAQELLYKIKRLFIDMIHEETKRK